MVDVGIIDPAGKKDSVKAVITRKSDDVWYVEYTAVVAGLHSVNVHFGGKPIPKSPYAVGVSAGLSLFSVLCLLFSVRPYGRSLAAKKKKKKPKKNALLFKP